jgi:hypothetical protein
VFQPVLDALSPKTTSAADKFEAAAQKTLDDSRQKEAKRRASCAVILDERVGVNPIRPIGVFECITTTVWLNEVSTNRVYRTQPAVFRQWWFSKRRQKQ